MRARTSLGATNSPDNVAPSVPMPDHLNRNGFSEARLSVIASPGVGRRKHFVERCVARHDFCQASLAQIHQAF